MKEMFLTDSELDENDILLDEISELIEDAGSDYLNDDELSPSESKAEWEQYLRVVGRIKKLAERLKV